MDSLVVVARRDSGLRSWANWLREDSGSLPYAWLRLPLPSLSSKIRWSRLLRSWLRLIFLMPRLLQVWAPSGYG